jgi:predicted exporter
MGPNFADLNHVSAAPAALAAALKNLADRSADRPGAGRLHAAAVALLGRLDNAAAGARAQTLAALDRALTADLPRELERLAAGLKAAPFDRQALPSVLAERWLARGGSELIEIVPKEDVSDNAAARRFVDAVRAVVPRATGLPVVYQEASRTVVQAFERALLYAFVMVTAIIFLVLRDVKDTLLVIVPIVFASAVTAGLTALIDLPLNYANIIALPLLVGIGVDNGIHVVHRMRTEDVAQLFGTSTMRAVLASGLTTVASFGNLAFSAHRGTASMGILLALGLAVSMSATLIVLPAWLKVFGRAAHLTG